MNRTPVRSSDAQDKPARQDEKPVLVIKADLNMVPEERGYDPYNNPGTCKATPPSRRPRASR